MKKLLLLGIGSALAFTMGGVGPAQADNGPHSIPIQTASTTGIVIANVGASQCASCHRAHTAQAVNLLKQAQPGLCYTCHGSSAPGSTTDVVNGSNGGAGALRGGGFANAKIASAAATKDMAGTALSYGLPSVNQQIGVLSIGTVSNSKHQIDGTSGTAWGNGATGSGIGKSLTLECGSCHDPHGNGNYRILKPIPVDSGYAVHEIKAAATDPITLVVTPAVMSPATGIKIPDAPVGAKVYTTTNYWLSGDTNVLPDATASLTGALAKDAAGVAIPVDGYIANIANWCTTCHTRYLADTGSYKTASGDAIYMYKHRSNANYKAGAANCITCHVSHGSNASVAAGGFVPGEGLTALTAGTGTAGADSKLLRVDNRGTCVMCHNV